MKRVVFFYNPILRKNKDGSYSIDVFMDKRGKIIELGTFTNYDYKSVLYNAWGVVNVFEKYFSNKIFYSKSTISTMRKLIMLENTTH